MIKKKKITYLLIFIIIGLLLYLIIFNPTFNYKTHSKLRVLPIEDWELQRTTTGSIISLHQNHYYKTTEKYSLSEFSRGDVIQIHFAEDLLTKHKIEKGDTVGYIISNQEQRSLAILKGQLEVLKSELLYFTTGQKPEDVDFAAQKVVLAEQEYRTQQKLMSRSTQLFKDSVISSEQYDIDYNALKVTEWNLAIARANLSSVTTGDKPEMELLVNAKISALEKELNWIETRINLLTITSPISGVLEVNHDQHIEPREYRKENLIKIINLEPKIGIIPVPLKKLKYFKEGVLLSIGESHPKIAISLQDNVAQSSLLETFLYYIVILPDEIDVLPGEIIDVVIEGNQISWLEYFKSLVQ